MFLALAFILTVGQSVCPAPSSPTVQSMAVTKAAEEQALRGAFAEWMKSYSSSSPLRAQNKTSAFPNTDAQVLAFLDQANRTSLQATKQVADKTGAIELSIPKENRKAAERGTLMLKRFIETTKRTHEDPTLASLFYTGVCHAYDFSAATQAASTNQAVFVGIPLSDSPKAFGASANEVIKAAHSAFAECISSFPASPALKSRVQQRWLTERNVSQPSDFVFLDLHTLDSRKQFDDFPADYFRLTGKKKVVIQLEGFDNTTPKTLDQIRSELSIDTLVTQVDEGLKKRGKKLTADHRIIIQRSCPNGICSVSPSLAGILDLADRIQKTGVAVEFIGLDTPEGSIQSQISDSLAEELSALIK